MIEEGTGTVIGIAVAVDRMAAAKVGWMVPLEVVAAYWPPLAEMLSDQPVLARCQVPLPVLFELVDRLLDVAVIADGGSRQQVLGLLRREISASVSRHAEARIDVLNLVRSCHLCRARHNVHERPTLGTESVGSLRTVAETSH